MAMADIDEHVAKTVRGWVWSGFYSRLQVKEMARDIVEDPSQEDATDFFINAECGAKRKAERTWPAETDCDRLDRAWETLRTSGVVALQNAGYTMSDGHHEVDLAAEAHSPDQLRGYAFYHGQDLERAVESGDLYIAFGSLDDNKERNVAVGQMVRDVLRDAGFNVEWNDDPQTRILIRGMTWRKRGPA